MSLFPAAPDGLWRAMRLRRARSHTPRAYRTCGRDGGVGQLLGAPFVQVTYWNDTYRAPKRCSHSVGGAGLRVVKLRLRDVALGKRVSQNRAE